MTTKQAERRVNRAIDAMVELQDGGFGDSTVERVLQLLREVQQRIDTYWDHRTVSS